MLNLKDHDIADFEGAYHEVCRHLENERSNHQNTIEYYKELIRILQKRLFGASADRISEPKGLFNEIEFESVPEDIDSSSQQEPTNVEGHTRKKPKRKPLPEYLPRKEIIYDLSAEERICACCNQEMHKIGEVISEQLDLIPAHIEVLRHTRIKYACAGCESSIKKAPMPKQAIPKSNAGPGLLAHLVISKYQDALPLYRQEEILKRIGIDLSRGVMASWMIKIADLVQPLLNLMFEDLLSGDVINCDETRVRVLKRNGCKVKGNSFMWVMGNWQDDRSIVLFEYDPTRHSSVPLRLFSEFEGYLQVDGYDAYNAVTKNYPIKRVGCFAHLRRKFIDCINSLQQKHRKKHSGFEAIDFIKKLYVLEDKIKNATIDEKKEARKIEAIPILDNFRLWITQKILEIPPKSGYGRALAYANNEWVYLIRYVEHGALRPDNNLAENAIRPFVIGRKNWLFSDTEKGAKASAALYSLIETAKANGREPYAYMRQVIEKIPTAQSLQDFEALLPYKKSEPKPK